MRRDFIYHDDRGRLRLAAESRRVGDRLIGPGTVALAERVVPTPGYAHPHLFGPGRREHARRQVYLYLRGIIFWAEESGSPSSGRVTYKKMWPVLRDTFQGDLDGLVDRIFTNKLDKETDIPLINSRLVRADNFFILDKNAWFSDRFHLYTGSLSNGRNFNGSLRRVEGVPKDADPDGDYNHIVRCWVYRDDSSTPPVYRMLTEERVMRSSGLRRAYENNRAVINEYVSGNMADWTFSRTVLEDLSIDPKDLDKRTPIPGLPVNYLPRVFWHSVSSGGTTQGTELSRLLGSIYPQPAGIHIEKAAGGYRAHLNRFGINTTWKSGNGAAWTQESTLNDAYSRQGRRIGGTTVVSVRRQ